MTDDDCDVCVHPMRAAELEARLADLARVHAETLDRLHQVERQRDELELRAARLRELVGEGGHTASTPSETVPISREVAEAISQAVRACEPWRRGAGLDRGRK